MMMNVEYLDGLSFQSGLLNYNVIDYPIDDHHPTQDHLQILGVRKEPLNSAMLGKEFYRTAPLWIIFSGTTIQKCEWSLLPHKDLHNLAEKKVRLVELTNHQLIFKNACEKTITLAACFNDGYWEAL